MRRLIVACVLTAGVGGCGLIDPDVTETSFALPEKTYSFDASTFNVPSGITTEIVCGVEPVVDCCNPTPPLPKPDCSTTTLTCEQNENGMNVCTATVTVSQSSTINLQQEVGALSGFSGVVDIKIKRIGYKVMPNTLNVEVPDIEVYLAPQGVTDTSDGSGAEKFGTVPAIPAAMEAAGDMILEPRAGEVFSRFTRNVATPFDIIAKTTLRVTRSPMGRIDVTITGTLAASL
jgi:hypothetical protein